MSTIYEDIEAIKYTIRRVAVRLNATGDCHPDVLVLCDVLQALESLRERIIEQERKES